MRVLQVIPSMSMGGVERGVLEISTHLKEKGSQPFVLCSGGALTEQLKANGIEVVIEPCLLSKNPINVFFVVPWKLLRIIKTHGIHIVHARSRTSAWSAWIACRIAGTRFLTTHHGAYSLTKGFWKRAIARPMLWGSFVVLPSSFLFSYVMMNQNLHVVDSTRSMSKGSSDPGQLTILTWKGWMVQTKAVIIPRGIDTSKFRLSEDNERLAERFAMKWRAADLSSTAKTVLLPGRVSRIKGQLDFIKALEKCGEIVNGVILGMPVRPNRFSQMLVNETERLRNEAGLNLRLEEQVHPDEMPGALLCADVVVIPSLTDETFCRAVVEALAMGKVVVAYEGGGISEIRDVIQNEGGEAFLSRFRLVTRGDIDALSEEIRRSVQLAHDPAPHRQHLQDLALKVSDFVKRTWSIQKLCDSEFEVYQWMMDKKQA